MLYLHYWLRINSILLFLYIGNPRQLYMNAANNLINKRNMHILLNVYRNNIQYWTSFLLYSYTYNNITMSIWHAYNQIVGILKIYYSRFWRLKINNADSCELSVFTLKSYRFKVHRYLFVWAFFHETCGIIADII